MAKLIPIEYVDFRRGINDIAAPDAVADNELVEAINCDLSERGGFAKRKGTEKYNEEIYDTNGISRMIRYGKHDGNILLVASGTTLRKWDGTVVKDEINTENLDWTVFGDKLYIVNGENYYQYDGTTFAEVEASTEQGADLTAVKRCKYLIQRQQQFFAAGDSENPNTIYYGELTYPNYFKATNQIKAISDDDDHIVGLYEFHKAMVVFKKRNIYAWYGIDPTDADMRFDKINVHTGTVSGRTVTNAENYLMYLAEDGVYALTGLEENYLSSIHVSKNITNTIKRLTNLDKACAVYHKGKYYCAVCDDGTGVNNKVLVGHVTMGYTDEQGQSHVPWTVYEGWNVGAWLVHEGELYYGDASEGQIYKVDVGYSDVTTPIKLYVKTKPYDCHGKFILKKIKGALLAFKQYAEERSTVKVTVKVDYIERTFLLDLDESLVWDEGRWKVAIWGWVDLVTKEIKISSKGHRVQFTFENDKLDQPVTVYGIGVLAKFKRARGNKQGVEVVK